MEQSVAFTIVCIAVRVISAGRPVSYAPRDCFSRPTPTWTRVTRYIETVRSWSHQTSFFFTELAPPPYIAFPSHEAKHNIKVWHLHISQSGVERCVTFCESTVNALHLSSNTGIEQRLRYYDCDHGRIFEKTRRAAAGYQ